MPANFHRDLPRGQAAEEAFERANYPWLSRADGYKVDFFTLDNETLELKSDHTAHPNFFLERWSDEAKEKPGGPWQSTCKWFAYLFDRNGDFYIFNRAELMERLESLDLSRFEKFKENPGYTTAGYAIPIVLLEDIAIKGNVYKQRGITQCLTGLTRNTSAPAEA